jgi:hypothetical protein
MNDAIGDGVSRISLAWDRGIGLKWQRPAAII